MNIIGKYCTIITNGVLVDVYSYAKGSTANIFISLDHKKAYKIFFMDSNERTMFIHEKSFIAETKAYEKLMDNEEYQNYIPYYYGKQNIQKISIKESDEDISSNFILNCCYCIEFIEGRFHKLNSNSVVRNKVRNALELKGYKYFEDSSYAYNIKEQEKFKLIDFSIIDVDHVLARDFGSYNEQITPTQKEEFEKAYF